jgi:hypothetical protein
LLDDQIYDINDKNKGVFRRIERFIGLGPWMRNEGDAPAMYSADTPLLWISSLKTIHSSRGKEFPYKLAFP